MNVSPTAGFDGEAEIVSAVGSGPGAAPTVTFKPLLTDAARSVVPSKVAAYRYVPAVVCVWFTSNAPSVTVTRLDTGVKFLPPSVDTTTVTNCPTRPSPVAASVRKPLTVNASPTAGFDDEAEIVSAVGSGPGAAPTVTVALLLTEAAKSVVPANVARYRYVPAVVWV